MILIIVISFPFLRDTSENITLSNDLKTALTKFFNKFCEQDIQSIDMNVPLFKPINFVAYGGMEQKWSALINQSIYFEGHYGDEIITLKRSACNPESSNAIWIFDANLKEFIESEYIILDIDDQKGLSFGWAVFYTFFYFLYIVFIIVWLIRNSLRNVKNIK